MVLTEHIYNQMEVDDEIVYEYFKTLEEGKIPTVTGLVDFLDETYDIGGFIYDTGIDYSSEELEDLYNKFVENE